ncbi:unnamed protein product [Musa hybrid cultivar]
MPEIGEIRVGRRVKDDTYRLTKVRSFRVVVSFEGSLIPCRQVDRPGMIGATGSNLAEQNVTVSSTTVGEDCSTTACSQVMVIGVDEEPNRETFKKIGDVLIIEEFALLQL